jgi:hypothetical protein
MLLWRIILLVKAVHRCLGAPPRRLRVLRSAAPRLQSHLHLHLHLRQIAPLPLRH